MNCWKTEFCVCALCDHNALKKTILCKTRTRLLGWVIVSRFRPRRLLCRNPRTLQSFTTSRDARRADTIAGYFALSGRRNRPTDCVATRLLADEQRLHVTKPTQYCSNKNTTKKNISNSKLIYLFLRFWPQLKSPIKICSGKNYFLFQMYTCLRISLVTTVSRGRRFLRVCLWSFWIPTGLI